MDPVARETVGGRIRLDGQLLAAGGGQRKRESGEQAGDERPAAHPEPARADRPSHLRRLYRTDAAFWIPSPLFASPGIVMGRWPSIAASPKSALTAAVWTTSCEPHAHM